MNFDWYGASVDAGPDETLAEALGAFDMASLVPTAPRHGFNRSMALKRGDTTLATVMWENLGDPDGESCFVQGTGRHAAPVAQWLRGWQPRHRVARADAAEDYSAPGAWDQISTVCLRVADEYRIDVEHAGDHHRAIKGRSFYLGGRTSVARAIVYEKGRQLDGDPDWVRLELRVRPGSRDAKYRASSLTPAQFYGCSKWTAGLASRLGQPEVARMSLGTVYREEDVLRSRKFLLRQYGPTLRGLLTECESWAAVGEWLGKRLGD